MGLGQSTVEEDIIIDEPKEEVDDRNFETCRTFIPKDYTRSCSLLFYVFDLFRVIPEVRSIIVRLIASLKKTNFSFCAHDNSQFLTEEGEVFIWGVNTFYSTGSKSIPMKLKSDYFPKNVSMISWTKDYFLVLSKDDKLYTWEEASFNEFLEIKFPDDKCSPITQICSGLYHSLILTEDNILYSIGQNTFGQLGIGDVIVDPSGSRIPIRVKNLDGKIIKQIVSGGSSSMILTSEGEIYSWGENSRYQLGLSSGNIRDEVLEPALAIYVPSKHFNFKMISCGFQHAMGLSEDGKVFSWGKDIYTGRPSYSGSPQGVKMTFPFRIKMISCGFSHSLVLSEEGKIYAWGDNEYGQLGLGYTQKEMVSKCNRAETTIPTQVPHTQQVKLTEDVILISAGRHNSFALTSCGKIYAWGVNNNGQLGIGNFVHSSVPKRVLIPKS